MEHFCFDEKLSNGSTYAFWKGRTADDDKIVTIQKISTAILPSSEIKKLQNEIEQVMKMKSRYLIQIYNYFVTPDRILVSQEYIQNGSLYNKLDELSRTPSGISRECINRWMLQISEAILEIHSNNLIHRKVRPSAIMITRDQSVLVGGYQFSDLIFYNSVLLYDPETQYMSPELFQKKEITSSVDIWAFGVLMYTLYNGFITPFPHVYSIIDYMKNPSSLHFDILPFSIEYIVSQCLSRNVCERISAKDLNTAIEKIVNTPSECTGYISCADVDTRNPNDIQFTFGLEKKGFRCSKSMRILSDLNSPSQKKKPQSCTFEESKISLPSSQSTINLKFNSKTATEHVTVSSDLLLAQSSRNSNISPFGYCCIGKAYLEKGNLQIKLVVEDGDRDICIGGCCSTEDITDPFVSDGLFVYAVEEGSIFNNNKEIVKDFYKKESGLLFVEMNINIDEKIVVFTVDDSHTYTLKNIQTPISPIVIFYSPYPQSIRIIYSEYH